MTINAGIITYHRALNYGAYLQSYASAMKFRELGLNSEIIDFDMPEAIRYYNARSYNPFHKYYKLKKKGIFENSRGILPLSDYSIITNNLDEFRKTIYSKYDILIAGSDEIWRTDTFRGFPNAYWLPDDYGQKHKIALAVSSRIKLIDCSSAKTVDMIASLINQFDLVTVRDKATFENLVPMVNDKSALIYCSDPTIMYDFHGSSENGKKLLFEQYGIKPGKKIIGLMTNDKKLVLSLVDKFKGKVVFVSLFMDHFRTKNMIDIDPFEWIDIVSSLDGLVTSFYHGMLFSIKCATNFIAVETREKNDKYSKLYDFLSRNKMLDRYTSISNSKYINDVISFVSDVLNDQVNGSGFDKVIEAERKSGEIAYNKIISMARL